MGGVYLKIYPTILFRSSSTSCHLSPSLSNTCIEETTVDIDRVGDCRGKYP